MSELVVITGASRGLGLALCRQLLNAGYRVLAISRTQPDALLTLAAQQPALSLEHADLSNLEQIQGLCNHWVKQYGRPYALVNNAAVGYDGVLATMHNSEIDALLKLNLQAPILLCKYLLRPMLLNQRGRIVNISSIIARTGFNGLSVYAASKAGLEGFSKSLARETGKAGITVNCVAPGYMQTDMTQSLQGDKLDSIKRRSPLGRLATPDDAAGAVVYLLSTQASAVTGTTITVDTGSTA
ncbi:SDR family NAD(P)-dependent oxidoreductase [Rheinheimera marina]|uniref:SDR family NAD(P)-dependent oxidoreductase n=1 Tax=Rheinheimera marina TaxID=1774958 RepID=A0ABV9JRN5_9GAMM